MHARAMFQKTGQDVVRLFFAAILAAVGARTIFYLRGNFSSTDFSGAINYVLQISERFTNIETLSVFLGMALFAGVVRLIIRVYDIHVVQRLEKFASAKQAGLLVKIPGGFLYNLTHNIARLLVAAAGIPCILVLDPVQHVGWSELIQTMSWFFGQVTGDRIAGSLIILAFSALVVVAVSLIKNPMIEALEVVGTEHNADEIGTDGKTGLEEYQTTAPA